MVWTALCVSDYTFSMPSYKDITKTTNLTLKYLKRFGIQMHTDKINNIQDAEILHIPKRFPASTTINKQPIILSYGKQKMFKDQKKCDGSQIKYCRTRS